MPYQISYNFITKSIVGFVSDSIMQLSTIYMFKDQVSIKDTTEYISIQLLNYILLNDSHNFIHIFFSQDKNEFNLLPYLIIIINEAFFIYKEACGFTFLYLLNGLIQNANDSFFPQFVSNKQIPDQFAEYIAAILNLDNLQMKNNLISSLRIFLEKISILQIQGKFISAIENHEIIQNIANDEDLDQEMVRIFFSQFFPYLLCDES